jgi:acyl carrier protein
MSVTNDHVWTSITEVVTELLTERGEDAGALAPESKIGAALGISSVEAIHMMIMLEDRLATPLSFNDLAVRDGQYVDDLSLGEIAAFICRTLGVPPSPAGAR